MVCILDYSSHTLTSFSYILSWIVRGLLTLNQSSMMLWSGYFFSLFILWDCIGGITIQLSGFSLRIGQSHIEQSKIMTWADTRRRRTGKKIMAFPCPFSDHNVFFSYNLSRFYEEIIPPPSINVDWTHASLKNDKNKGRQDLFFHFINLI